ncbi:hypothetical protein BC628DRAFT_1015430 [Trametes gibbosa]|nr:hypothetical protein BC628DRAFT_1015430 [Trametes gibbosa]
MAMKAEFVGECGEDAPSSGTFARNVTACLSWEGNMWTTRHCAGALARLRDANILLRLLGKSLVTPNPSRLPGPLYRLFSIDGRRPAMAPSRFPRLNFSFKPFWSSLLTPPPPMADPLSSGTLSALLNISNGHAFPVEDLHAQYAHTAARTSTVTIDPADITPGVEPDPVEPFPSIRIDAVELRKRSGIFPEHEYLIVYISKDNDSAYAIAKIERTIDSSNPPNLRANVKRTSNIASTSTTSLHDLSRSLSNHSVAAKDYLTINPNTEQHLKTFTQGDVAVYSYTYPPRDRPSITRLVAAALVVHNSQPDYILLSSQCYWYAGVLFRLLVGPNAERLHSAQPVQAAVPSGSLALPVQSAVPPSSDPRSDPQPPQDHGRVLLWALCPVRTRSSVPQATDNGQARGRCGERGQAQSGEREGGEGGGHCRS